MNAQEPAESPVVRRRAKELRRQGQTLNWLLASDRDLMKLTKGEVSSHILEQARTLVREDVTSVAAKVPDA